ncbi:unnamed protein product [Vitrella brassicaformis CCMP3155]|uniref:Oxidation resistance protein 1 n=2 Tax=Vitrella brassicaformis TaxID=1169539 RepID=A0A0G4GTD8_VITBC|nr:unnamed protein product [Vitrella brassicaformis CCMP3155]|eukprot:CEM34006.1 unnamed protein product [Vitrella brassicaformis CCMP3155]
MMLLWTCVGTEARPTGGTTANESTNADGRLTSTDQMMSTGKALDAIQIFDFLDIDFADLYKVEAVYLEFMTTSGERIEHFYKIAHVSRNRDARFVEINFESGEFMTMSEYGANLYAAGATEEGDTIAVFKGPAFQEGASNEENMLVNETVPAGLRQLQVHLRGLQASRPNGTSLSASEYKSLLGLLGNDTTELTSLYRMSVHGSSYGDLLDRVGDAKPLVFVVKKDKYVFGVYISAGIQPPDDPTSSNVYGSDVWWFSLAGHFPQPTKIDIDRAEQALMVGGRKGNANGANMGIGGTIRFGDGGTVDGQPAADIRSCHQLTLGDYVPEEYTGVRDEYGDVVLGGSDDFIADEIEVLEVPYTPVPSLPPPSGTSLSASEYEGLLGLLGNATTRLTSLYRTSLHGTTYDDLLDRVGDAKPIVFVIRANKYVFGAFISEGIQLPADPTDTNFYSCDIFSPTSCAVWHFSLAGDFPRPTKIEFDREHQSVWVAGREGSILRDGERGGIEIGRDLWFDQPAPDMRSCVQFTPPEYVPESYTGERDELDDDGWLGGSIRVMADEIEVLQVGQ